MPMIAVVEHDPLVRLDIERTLKIQGYEVAGCFADGDSFLRALGGISAEILVLDTSGKGESSLAEIATKAFLEKGIYTILISALEMDGAFKSLEAAAPIGIIMKPFTERELLGTLEVAIHRAEMARKLSRSEERYRNLFDTSIAPRCICSNSGNILEANESFASLFGTTSGDFGTLRLLLEDKSAWDHIEKSLKSGKPIHGREYSLKTPSGQVYSILGSFSSFMDVDRGERLISCEFFDLTESKRLRDELYQAQKMEAMGRLAGGVAHDFNNILTAIMGHAEMMNLDIPTGHPSREDVEGIRRTAERASRLTKQLLGFSRKQSYAPRLLDLGVIIKDIGGLLRKLSGDGILFSLSIPPKPLYVVVDPMQIEQVCINLVVNARDALENRKNPRISLIVSEQKIDTALYASLEINDNGKGIPAEIKEKIFDPFFTTKPAGKGTGLGLAIVRSIARQIEAIMRVESQENLGTTFSFLIPIAEAKEEAKEPKSSAIQTEASQTPILPTLSAEIIIVEDDEYLLGFLSHVIGKAGAKVLAARNAGEALILAEESNFSAALMDVSLPGLSGTALYRRLSEKASIPCLFMSGGNPDTLDLPPNARFIEKPFTPEQLIGALANMLSPQERINE